MESRRLALAGLSATVSVAFGALLYALSVLITDEAAGAEFSVGLLSLGYGGTVLVGGGLAYVVGRAADRHGVRSIVAIGTVLGAGGLAALASAREPWQVLLAMWFLIGPAGAMTFYEPAFVAVDQWYEPAERGRAIGILTLIGGLAGPVFLPLTAWLVDGMGWRSATRVLSATLAVVGLIAAGSALPSGGQPDRGRAEDLSVRVLAADRRFVLYTAGILLLYGAFQTVLLHRIALFEDHGITVGLVSLWAAISGWLSFPGRYAGPILGSAPKGVTWNAALCGLLAVSLVPALTAGTAPMVLHFSLFGVAFGAVLPMRAAVMARWYSGPAFGRIMGVQWTLAAFAGAAGPAISGSLRDATGTYGPVVWGGIVAFALAGGLVLIAGRTASNTPTVGGASGL